MLKGTVTTAFPLTPQEKAALEGRFSSLLGEAVLLEERVDPSLLAGVTVEVGGSVYDGSLRARLKDVERLLENETEGGEEADADA